MSKTIPHLLQAIQDQHRQQHLIILSSLAGQLLNRPDTALCGQSLVIHSTSCQNVSYHALETTYKPHEFNIPVPTPSTKAKGKQLSSTSGTGLAPTSSNLSNPSSLGCFLAKYNPRQLLHQPGSPSPGRKRETILPSSSSPSWVCPPPPTLGMDCQDLNQV